MPIIWTAKRIKKLRFITRNSQATFSGIVGVSRVTISNWESEFKTPSARHQATLDNIAKEYGVTQRQLDR
jgi:DNA-binding transcriptional regulator YiaG